MTLGASVGKASLSSTPCSARVPMNFLIGCRIRGGNSRRFLLCRYVQILTTDFAIALSTLLRWEDCIHFLSRSPAMSEQTAETVKPHPRHESEEHAKADRDLKGRFLAGNPGGPRNPFNRQTAAFKKAIQSATT